MRAHFNFTIRIDIEVAFIFHAIVNDYLLGPKYHMDELLFYGIKISEDKNKMLVFTYKKVLFILYDINRQIRDGGHSVLSAHTTTRTEKYVLSECKILYQCVNY